MKMLADTKLLTLIIDIFIFLNPIILAQKLFISKVLDKSIVSSSLLFEFECT